MCEIGGECQLSEGRKDMALSLVGIEFGRSLRIVATRVQQLNDFRVSALNKINLVRKIDFITR